MDNVCRQVVITGRDAAELADVKPQATMLGGRWVFDRR